MALYLGDPVQKQAEYCTPTIDGPTRACACFNARYNIPPWKRLQGMAARETFNNMLGERWRSVLGGKSLSSDERVCKLDKVQLD